MSNISRQAYADMFGPTVGDKVRLADTELWIEVEDDLTTYGEEVKFGGGKVIRDGMGHLRWRSAAHRRQLRLGHHNKGQYYERCLYGTVRGECDENHRRSNQIKGCV